MRYNFFPPEHHDFANSADIRREAAHNQHLLEANFLGNLNLFRASVAQKLLSCGALSPRGGWAIFNQECIEEDDGALKTLPGGKETLIKVSRGKFSSDNGYQVPNIRIITNELIRTQENDQWLTQDFTADDKNDTQYFVDAVNPQSQSVDSTLAPLFFVTDDGELMATSNTAAFTPAIGVLMPERPRIAEAIPFGHFINLEDKIHALSVGSALLEEVSRLEPTYSTPSQ